MTVHPIDIRRARFANRHGIAALKQDLHPPLHAVPTNPGASHA